MGQFETPTRTDAPISGYYEVARGKERSVFVGQRFLVRFSRLPPSLEITQQEENIRQIFIGNGMGFERAQDQILHRTFEGAPEQVAGDPAAGFFPSDCLVDVGAVTLSARKEALFGHHLQLLEGGGVAGRLAKRLVDFAHRARTEPPKRCQNVQLGIGGKKGHAPDSITIIIVCQQFRGGVHADWDSCLRHQHNGRLPEGRLRPVGSSTVTWQSYLPG